MINTILAFKVIDDGFGGGQGIYSENQFVHEYGRDFTDDTEHKFFDYSEDEQCSGVEIWNGVRVVVKRLSFQQMRSATGFSQRALAEYLWVPRRTLENWEIGTECPAYLHNLIFEKLVREGKFTM